MDPIIEIGQEAPHFQLSDIKGEVISLTRLLGWIIILNFWSAECVWCERVDHELMGILDTWKEHVKVVWIASNANESRNLIERVAIKRNLPTVFLDEHQEVADLYGAETTPHFFVVNANGVLAYQGSWDDITFRQRAATQVFVPKVVEALMQNIAPQISQTPPYGCVLVRYSDSND